MSGLGRSSVPHRMSLMTFQSFLCDTGALTLHDNSIALRVGTQETLAEHRLLEEWNSPQKLEIIYKQIHISMPFWRAENISFIY